MTLDEFKEIELDAARFRHLCDEMTFHAGDGYTEPMEASIELEWRQGPWVNDGSNNGKGHADYFPGWATIIDKVMTEKQSDDDIVDADFDPVEGIVSPSANYVSIPLKLDVEATEETNMHFVQWHQANPAASMREAWFAGRQHTEVTEDQLEAILRRPVGEGEDVYWSIVFGLNSDPDDIQGIMVREIVRTILARPTPLIASQAVEDAMQTKLMRRVCDVLEGLEGMTDLPGSMPVRVRKLRDAVAAIEGNQPTLEKGE